MGRYIIRRLLQFIPVFLGATLLIYSLVFWLPGDPIRALSGERPLPEQVQKELRDRFNLDDPFIVQYGKYMGLLPQDVRHKEGGKTVTTQEFSGLLQGQFGTNFRGRPVSDIMAQSFPVTIKLALMAFVLEVIFGIAIGVLAGLKSGSLLDNFVKISTIFAISVPILVTAYVAQLVIGVELKWLPVAYRSSNQFESLILPAIVLSSLSMAYVARLTRTSLIENRRADYVRTARAKGLPNNRVVIQHTLRNSLIPVVTYLGIDLGGLMGGAIVTESIFNIPGIGRAAYMGITNQEGTVVVGIVTSLVLVFMISNLLVDLLYAALDPRIRYE